MPSFHPLLYTLCIRAQLGIHGQIEPFAIFDVNPLSCPSTDTVQKSAEGEANIHSAAFVFSQRLVQISQNPELCYCQSPDFKMSNKKSGEAQESGDCPVSCLFATLVILPHPILNSVLQIRPDQTR